VRARARRRLCCPPDQSPPLRHTHSVVAAPRWRPPPWDRRPSRPVLRVPALLAASNGVAATPALQGDGRVALRCTQPRAFYVILMSAICARGSVEIDGFGVCPRVASLMECTASRAQAAGGRGGPHSPRGLHARVRPQHPHYYFNTAWLHSRTRAVPELLWLRPAAGVEFRAGVRHAGADQSVRLHAPHNSSDACGLRSAIGGLCLPAKSTCFNPLPRRWTHSKISIPLIRASPTRSCLSSFPQDGPRFLP
jgi:hypothetical protein